MKWKITTYYTTFEGEVGSVTDHFNSTFRKGEVIYEILLK